MNFGNKTGCNLGVFSSSWQTESHPPDPRIGRYIDIALTLLLYTDKNGDGQQKDEFSFEFIHGAYVCVVRARTHCMFVPHASVCMLGCISVCASRCQSVGWHVSVCALAGVSLCVGMCQSVH